MEAWVHLGGVHGLDSVLIVAIPPLRHQQAPCSTTHRARSNGATRLTGELTFTVAPRSLASQSTKQNGVGAWAVSHVLVPLRTNASARSPQLGVYRTTMTV